MTGDFCAAGGRIHPGGSWYADEEIQPEQIVTLLRQIEVEIANGKTTPQACRETKITAQMFFRW